MNNVKEIKVELEKLAKEMNVTVKDLFYFSQSLINSLQEDRMVEAYLNSSSNERAELIEAYIPGIIKKWEGFQTTYDCNPKAREELIKTVYSLLT